MGFIQRILHPPRRAIPTRAGLFALATPIVLGVAAISSTNNLLFILLGAALGSIVLSGVLSERNLRGVQVSVKSSSATYRGEPTRLVVEFSRPTKRDFRPAYGLRIRERPKGLSLLRFAAGPQDGGKLDVTLAVLDKERVMRVGERTFEYRGKAKLLPCELITQFPFALLNKSRDIDADVDILVRPRRVPVPEALVDPRGVAPDGDNAVTRGAGVEVYGLREREDRDSLLRVHGLRSLALGKEVVLETAGVERPMAWLGVVNQLGGDDEAFERTLEVASATLTEWVTRGYAVGLVTLDGRFFPDETSTERMLDILALLEPVDHVDVKNPEGVFWLMPKGVHFAARVGAVVEGDGEIALVGDQK